MWMKRKDGKGERLVGIKPDLANVGQNRDPSVFPWGEEGGYVIPAGE